MSEVKTFDFGPIDGVRYAVFQWGDRKITCGLDDLPSWNRKEITGVEQSAAGINMGDTIWDRFYLIYCANCAFPPLAIVRCDSEQSAEEYFVENCPWCHIQEPDLSDYGVDDLSYGPNGEPYDSSEIMIHQVKLISVHC